MSAYRVIEALILGKSPDPHQIIEAVSMVSPHPTIEIDAERAYLRCGDWPPLAFEWLNYPNAFAIYMNELQRMHLEVDHLHQLTTKEAEQQWIRAHFPEVPNAELR